MAMTEPAQRVHPAALIPPPFLFAAAFVLGWLVQRRLHARPTDAVAEPLLILAIALAVAGAYLALGAVGLFASRGTTFLPYREPSAIVVSGPYRLSRNPMYLGLILLYLGLAVWTQIWWALAFLPLPLFVLTRYIIPLEEAQLRRRFGEEYAAYTTRVRRWL
jgi:protein-S-isoprenylcysteine O-methyltransferase Ste14